MKDYYSLLRVRQFASAAEVKRAYRRLALQYHPDKNPDPSAEAIIKEINEAYDLLGDPAKKEIYDQLLSGKEVLTSVYSNVPKAERYAAHRDPAYRGNGRHSRPVISKRERLFQIVRHYHPKMLWISRVSIALGILFFLDYYIPYSRVEETIEYSRIASSHSEGADYNLILNSGNRIKVYKTNFRFKDGESLLATYTRLYHIPISLQKTSGDVIDLGYMYNTLLFLPLALLVVSAMAVFFRSEIEFSFNLIVLNGMLLLINFVFI
jgi:hypothetical protein